MSQCELLNQMAENLLVHMRWIRMRTISENDRASRSIIDHMNIIEALESRDANLAERLVARTHARPCRGMWNNTRITWTDIDR